MTPINCMTYDPDKRFEEQIAMINSDKLTRTFLKLGEASFEITPFFASNAWFSYGTFFKCSGRYYCNKQFNLKVCRSDGKPDVEYKHLTYAKISQYLLKQYSDYMEAKQGADEKKKLQ